LLPLTLLVGCFRAYNPEYPNTNLGGTVTLDGTPIPSGIITFTSQDPTNGHVVVSPIIRGRYIAESVPLGKVLAVVNAYEETGRRSGGGGRGKGKGQPEIVNVIPQQYREGFALDVTPASARVDFPMTTTD
jgi:hypothetical protein